MDDQIKDLKELFQTKMDALVTKIDANHEIQNQYSNNILEQAKKTNNRVDKLEMEVDKIKNNDTHFRENRAITCPRLYQLREVEKKIEGINDNLSEVKLIKKYPKMAITVISVLVILLTLTIFSSINNLLDNPIHIDNNKKIENKK